MPLKIVRNDITRMDTDAIVNTAGEVPVVGEGCDTAVHNAAGYEELLQYRIDHIGKNGRARSSVHHPIMQRTGRSGADALT